MFDIPAIIKGAIALGKDPYVELAKVMFNTISVSTQQRRIAKSTAFQYIYSTRNNK